MTPLICKFKNEQQEQEYKKVIKGKQKQRQAKKQRLRRIDGVLVHYLSIDLNFTEELN